MAVPQALGAACPVRAGEPADAVAGVIPSYVATPGTVEQVAAVMRAAAAGSLAVVPRGAGTRIHSGAAPKACDLVVDLSGLDRIVDHAAGDMVVQVEAGVPVARLNQVVAGAGQQLALDTPSYQDNHGTVGGALAVAASGPRRLRYGSGRDLLLGVTMVRADGVVASSGGRVVKNVAGYDVGKLLCGSYGTLGLIVSATLRLHPQPTATGHVSATVPDAVAGHRCAEALLSSQLAASAVELDRPEPGGPVTVVALFEGSTDGVAARTAAAADLAGGAVVREAPGWFGHWPGDPGGTLVQLTFPPAGLVVVLDAVTAAAGRAGLAVPVRGSAAVAELQAGLAAGAAPEAVAAFLSVLRTELGAHQGAAVVLQAPPAVRDAVDPWGPADPGALALMRRVKDQFDPDHRLAPGRFVGGI